MAKKKAEIERFEMRFAGSGGQGVILASVIIAEAAVAAGKFAVQSQSYGPEARGGACKGEAIVSSSEIWFSKLTKPTFLLALTAEALNKYSGDLTDGAVIMADSHLEIPEKLKKYKVISVPILETAASKVGRPMTANIVAVGAINEALGLFDQKTLEEGIRRHVPDGTFDINKKAMEEGIKLISGR